MDTFFIQINFIAAIIISSLFFATATLFFLLLQKYTLPPVAGFLKKIAHDPQNLLYHLPVNPLVLKCTRAEFFEHTASFYQYRRYFTYQSVLRYKEISSWLALIITTLLFLKAPLDQALFLSAAAIITALRWPEWFLSKQDKEIKRLAERDLSSIIDLLRLFVSAGQNLEQAIRHIASPRNGWWGIFFIRLVAQFDAGKNFDQALSDSADRLNSADYRRFVIALKQAQTLGVPLSTTLSVQAALLRSRRRQIAETAARKASVKIALPLALCIFPALLIIYLTPAVLRLFNEV